MEQEFIMYVNNEASILFDLFNCAQVLLINFNVRLGLSYRIEWNKRLFGDGDSFGAVWL